MSNSSTNRRRHSSEEEGISLKYGASHVIQIFIPVIICMAIVVVVLKSTTVYERDARITLYYIPYTEEDTQGKGTAEVVGMNVANVLILVSVIVFMTVILVLLFYFKCYLFLYGWVILATGLLLFVFSFYFCFYIFEYFNTPVDYVSLAIVLWNFGMIGQMVIHWRGPAIVRQFYQICSCALAALMFIKILPEWTAWLLLGFIAVWDLIAVLTPCGPLRILVNLWHSHQESAERAGQRPNTGFMAALIYSSGMMWDTVMIMGVDKETNKEKSVDSSQRQGPAVLPLGEDNQLHREHTSDGRQTQQSTLPSSKSTRIVTTAAESEDANNPITVRVSPANVQSNIDNTKQSKRLSSDHLLSGDNLIDGTIDHGDNLFQDHEVTNVDGVAQDGDISIVATPDAPAATSSRPDITAANPTRSEEGEESDGVKLGLGDFIFYSILVGKSSQSGDWYTTIACFMAILIGLCLTLLILAIKKKPLPALPISIFFGLIFYFFTKYTISPFMEALTANQVFV